MTVTAFLSPLPLSSTPQNFRPSYISTTRCSATATSPILSPSPAPAWDSLSVSSPYIHRYTSEVGPSYAMWYSARSTTSDLPFHIYSESIDLAISSDGLNWTTQPEPVLAPNPDWWIFDTSHLSVGSVLLDSYNNVRTEAGVYVLYYVGGDKSIVQVPFHGKTREMQSVGTRIGVAISKDGEHFSRIEGDFPSGAILEPGAGGWGGVLLGGCNVVKVNDKFVMHYFTYLPDQSNFGLGRAVSSDGFNFKPDSTGPIIIDPEFEREGGPAELGYRRCHVVQRGERWLMFCEITDSARVHRIAMCESKDCRSWGPLTMVFEPGEDGEWDSAGVSHPFVVDMGDGSARLYYVGKSQDYNVAKGKGTSIGVAESNGEDWTVFHRISAS